MYQKWNLISVPFNLLSPNIEEVFSQLEDDNTEIKGVWAYVDGEWLVYMPESEVPAEDEEEECVEDLDLNITCEDEVEEEAILGPQSLEVIEPGFGYWVLADCQEGYGQKCADLIVGGSLLSPAPGVPPSRELQQGWNLIGHYGTESKAVYCSLFSLIDTTIGYPKWGALYGYESPTSTFVELNAMNPSHQTEPGKGYWIEMDVDELYAPATTCWGFALN